MNLGTLILFFLLAAASGILVLYLIILGMAPGVKPLDWTGVFLYSPGPGFFLLLGWLILASILQIFAWVARIRQLGNTSKLCNRISWILLGLLLILELVMLFDFNS